MKNEIVLNLRQFPVTVHDHRDGQEKRITVTVAKNQLQAAQIVGQSSKELVERLCERQGFQVLEIGKPEKRSITVDLGALEWMTAQYEQHREEQDKWNYLHGIGGEAGA